MQSGKPAVPSSDTSGRLATRLDLDMKLFKTAKEFSSYYESVSRDRLKMEEELAAKNKDNPNWHVKGYCQICEKETEFLIEHNNPKSIIPMYRSTLVCKHCALMNRRRFMASLLKTFVKEGGFHDVYTYECISPFYNVIQQNLKK